MAPQPPPIVQQERSVYLYLDVSSPPIRLSERETGDPDTRWSGEDGKEKDEAEDRQHFSTLVPLTLAELVIMLAINT